MYIHIYLSLSLYIYIYIYIHTQIFGPPSPRYSVGPLRGGALARRKRAEHTANVHRHSNDHDVYIVLYYLYRIIYYYDILYYTILYYIVFYSIILCYIVL